jgi:hypothetical protein
MNLAPRILLAFTAALLAGTAAHAQVPISGVIFDGSGGPLLSGTVYHAGSLTIPAGETLTVQAGAIVKFNTTGTTVNVNGTLDVNGTSGSPVVLTSIEDDAAGGDTNGNGAVAPAPGDWRNVTFTSADTSTLDWCELRYGGSVSSPLIFMNGADISLSNCTLRDALDDAIDLNGSSLPTVSNCTFTGCKLAVDHVDIDAVPGFTNNSASGNTGNYIHLTHGTLSADATITSANVLEGALVIGTSTVNVTSGKTLTLQAGVVLKAALTGCSWNVNAGTLIVNGTEANPVVFTSFPDDSAGGDTNGDGASSGAPGDWRGLKFTNSDSSTLERCEVRYAGFINDSTLFLNGSEMLLSNCTVRDGLADGMSLNTSSLPTVRGCNFMDNGGVAVSFVSIEAVPGFSFNTATGNGAPGVGGNYMGVISASVNSPVSIEDHSVLGGALVMIAGTTIGSGGHLVLGPGVVLKMMPGKGFNTITSGAQITFDGTAARPVVVTSFLDDTVAGDTNLDGSATTPTSGDWTSLFVSTGSVTLTHSLFRYGGAGPQATIFGNFLVPLSMESVRVEHGLGTGFELRSAPKADRLCAFNNAQGFELTSGSYDLTRCTAVANGTGFNTYPGFSGRILSSIGWGNGINFGNVFPTLLFSNGSTPQAGSNGNIDTDPLFVDQVGGDLRLTALSPCLDTGDPAAEQDPDCTRTDMGAHIHDQGGAPTTYCTAKINSQGCTPFVDFTGYASATDSAPFLVTGNDVLNQKSGLFFYGYGPHNGNFQGGTKCVLSPTKRTAIQNSGGDPSPNTCSGTYVFDMNARIQSGVDAGLIPGVDVYGQFWMRDPTAPFTTGLTDAIQVTICP